MSLNIQPAVPGGLPVRPSMLPAGIAATAGSTTRGHSDQAVFSAVSVLLAQLQGDPGTAPALPAPGSETARVLATFLAQRLGTLLQSAGLPMNPAVAFEVRGDNRVEVTTTRPDANQVQVLVDNNADVQDLVRLLQAINQPTATALAAAALATAAHSDALAGVATNPPSTHAPLFHPWGWPGAAGRRRGSGIPGLLAWRWWLVATLIGASLLWWLL